ncbi:MAG: DUF3379 family protein, partial [Lysobacterales bacterium]
RSGTGESPWRYYAMAASIVVAVAAAGIFWRVNSTHFDSVEDYVAYHYTHDGQTLVVRGQGQSADNIDEVLNALQVGMTPELSHMVELIQFCPTPDGKGAHLVLNTDHGPITVIFMPNTPVIDGEEIEFDGMQARLVTLAYGSAAIIGTDAQHVADFSALVQNSIIPVIREA